VGFAREDGLSERPDIVGREIFQISVEVEDELTGGGAQTRGERAALALIPAQPQEGYGGKARHDRGSRISRAVVHDDDFFQKGMSSYRRENVADPRGFHVGANDARNIWHRRKVLHLCYPAQILRLAGEDDQIYRAAGGSSGDFGSEQASN